MCKTTKALLESEGCADGLPVLFTCVGVVGSNLGVLGSGGESGLLSGLFLPAGLFVQNWIS